MYEQKDPMNNEQEEKDIKNEEDADTEETQDVSFEEVNEEGEVDVKTTIKKLREKIKKLESEKQEYLDISQRTRADYVNFKKEVEAARVLDRKFATKRFIEELLPVLDAYDMAKGNSEAWDKVDSNWRVGIEYIFGQLYAVLEREGVIQYGKVGELFTPELYESIELVETDDTKQEGKIAQILQSGYKMGDSILRVARVKVYSGTN